MIEEDFKSRRFYKRELDEIGNSLMWTAIRRLGYATAVLAVIIAAFLYFGG